MTIRTFLQAVFGSLLFSLGLGANAAQTLSVAVVPQFPAEQIFRDWAPVLKEVSRLTGLDLKLKTYASICPNSLQTCGRRLPKAASGMVKFATEIAPAHFIGSTRPSFLV